MDLEEEGGTCELYGGPVMRVSSRAAKTVQYDFAMFCVTTVTTQSPNGLKMAREAKHI